MGKYKTMNYLSYMIRRSHALIH